MEGVEHGRLPADGGGVEECGHGEPLAEGGVDALLQGRDEQGVAAEVEEVVVDAGDGGPEELGPDRGEALLGGGDGLQREVGGGDGGGRLCGPRTRA